MSEMNDEATDDKLIARRGRRLKLGIIPIAVMSGLALVFLLDQPSTAFGGHKAALIVALLVAEMVAVIGLAAWVASAPRDLRVERALMRRVDVWQRKRSRALLVLSLCLMAMSYLVWTGTGDIIGETADWRIWLRLAGPCDIALLSVTFILGSVNRKAPPVFNDEFSRLLRARALFTGLGLLFFGAIGVFALGVHDPRLAVQAIPLLLLNTVAIAGGVFAVMDLWADRT